MNERDADTLGFYAAEAEIYAGRARELGEAGLRRFAGLLPAGGRVLELGCGGGHDSEALLALGVWANACLLHVPRPALPDILTRVQRALRPGGVFYASYKAGEAEGRDRFGRYYNYPDAAWLRTAYGKEGWDRIGIEEDLGGGYDQEPTRWLHATAIKLS